MAINRPFTNQNGEKEADFINIVVWRKQAENANKYLSKGKQCAVDGRIQTRNYDDEDGKKRYITEVIADNIEYLSNNKNDNNQEYQNQNIVNNNDFEDKKLIDFDDDNLPF